MERLYLRFRRFRYRLNQNFQDRKMNEHLQGYYPCHILSAFRGSSYHRVDVWMDPNSRESVIEGFIYFTDIYICNNSFSILLTSHDQFPYFIINWLIFWSTLDIMINSLILLSFSWSHDQFLTLMINTLTLWSIFQFHQIFDFIINLSIPFRSESRIHLSRCVDIRKPSVKY